MSLWEKGRAKTGGRAKGARNKISASFLEALADDFEAHGKGVIEMVRVEKPHEYLKVVAAILPKEFEITETKLMEYSDDDLRLILEHARRLSGETDSLSAGGKSGTGTTIN